MRKYLARFVALGMLLVLPSPGHAQSTTDRSEMDQWVKDTANQGADLPVAPRSRCPTGSSTSSSCLSE